MTINKKYVPLLGLVGSSEGFTRLVEDNGKTFSSIDIGRAKEIAEKSIRIS